MPRRPDINFYSGVEPSHEKHEYGLFDQRENNSEIFKFNKIFVIISLLFLTSLVMMFVTSSRAEAIESKNWLKKYQICVFVKKLMAYWKQKIMNFKNKSY